MADILSNSIQGRRVILNLHTGETVVGDLNCRGASQRNSKTGGHVTLDHVETTAAERDGLWKWDHHVGIDVVLVKEARRLRESTKNPWLLGYKPPR